MLGISESNAGTRLHRAMTKLREACDEAHLETTTELAATPARSCAPRPRPDFAAELDARAAAGFPRRVALRRGLPRVRERLRATPPRRLLAPGRRPRVAAIVVATAVVANRDRRHGRRRSTQASLTVRTAEPAAGSRQPRAPPRRPRAGESRSGLGGRQHGRQSRRPPRALRPLRRPAPAAARSSAPPRSSSAPTPPRSADAGRVFDAVHAADGIVLNSSIRDGEAGRRPATSSC